MSFLNAFRFLTIIPIPVKTPAREEQMGRSLAFFPLVGFLIGLFLAVFDWALSIILPTSITTALAIALLAFMTGALHLDGFIDSMDGLFLHGGPEKRLKVMSDSRVGSFGVIGAFLLLLLKYISLANIPESYRFLSLMIMPALGRWSVVWPIFLFPYARPTGLGKAFKAQATWIHSLLATLMALALSIAIFRYIGPILMAGIWVLIMAIALFISRRLSGLTGDSYGALIEMAELFSLMLLPVLLSPK